MRILIVTDGSPYPVTSYEGVRMYNLIRRIAREHEVWLAVLTYSEEEAAAARQMETWCQGVTAVVYERRSPLAHLPRLAAYALRGRPLELVFYHSPALFDEIRRLTASLDLDVVHIEHSYNALYAEAIPAGARCKRLLVFRNVVFDQYARMAQVEWRPVIKMRNWLNSRLMRRWEPRYAATFDRLIALSKADREKLLAVGPRLQIDVVPNGSDTRRLQPMPPPAEPPSLIFVGNMNYTANADAAAFLSREILPHISRRMNGIETWIVGRDPLPEVQALAGERVHVTGWVDDVVPYYGQSAVSVVPLRAGSGIRLKILESMALGRPVVSTALGCEGIDVVDGKHIMIADTPELFAEKTVRLLTDQDLYDDVVANARELVVQRYDWGAIAERIMGIYAEMLGRENES